MYKLHGTKHPSMYIRVALNWSLHDIFPVNNLKVDGFVLDSCSRGRGRKNLHVWWWRNEANFYFLFSFRPASAPYVSFRVYQSVNAKKWETGQKSAHIYLMLHMWYSLKVNTPIYWLLESKTKIMCAELFLFWWQADKKDKKIVIRGQWIGCFIIIVMILGIWVVLQ